MNKLLPLCLILCIILTACGSDESPPPAVTLGLDLSSVPTEMVDGEKFCNDESILAHIEALKTVVRNRDGQQLADLVSPDGLYMSLYPSTQPVHLTLDEVRNFFDDSTVRDWGIHQYSGQTIEAALATDVVDLLNEDLLAENVIMACNDNQDGLSNQSVLYSIYTPDYTIGNFYSLMRPGPPGNELSWGAWGVAFEYRQGKPLLTILSHYQWTP